MEKAVSCWWELNQWVPRTNEKRCVRLGIAKPPRGYWAKLKAGAYLPAIVYDFWAQQ